MNITQRGDKWTCRINLDTVDGKRKQKRITQNKGETYDQFYLRCAKLEERVKNGQYIELTDMSVRKYLVEWMKHQKTKANPIALNTAHTYQYMIDHYINKHIGDKLLIKLHPLDIENLYKKLKKKIDTAIYCHRILNAALKRAMKWRYIQYNPMDGVDAPVKTEKVKTEVWDAKQVDKFSSSDAAGHVIFMPALIAAMSGLRRGEVCGLTWDCIDYENKTITVNKQLQRLKGMPLYLCKVKTHRSNRPVVISEGLCDILKEYHKKQQAQKEFLTVEQKKDADDPKQKKKEYCTKVHSILTGKMKQVENNLVCRWQDGRPIDPDYISKEFPLLCEDYGLPKIRFHALRHSHATALIKAGVRMFIISKRLGHAAEATTSNIYGHDDLEMQQESANVIKLSDKKKAE